MNNVMKICLAAAAAVLLTGGFLFLATMEVPVKQTQIVKTIPNEQFFKSN